MNNEAHSHSTPTERLAVVIQRIENVFRGYFKIERVTFSHNAVSEPGRRAAAIVREVFERGDSVAALLHVKDRDTVMLAEQFRIATYEKGPGVTWEVPAGAIDANETPETAIRREVLEETGFRISALEPIATFYVSPGGSTERIFLYYAAVAGGDLQAPQARGLAEEGEDVRQVELPADAFLQLADTGGLVDAKTLIAAQWLAIRRSARS